MIQVREGCYVSKHICLIKHLRQKNATLWKFSVILNNSNCMNSKAGIVFYVYIYIYILCNDCCLIIFLQVVSDGKENKDVYLCVLDSI